MNPSGILVIDKPATWTSFDVVAKVRRIFNIKKVGHAGTLDPMATGVLIVLVGPATKLSDQLLGQDKTYQATLLFGQQTDTGDADGQIINSRPANHVTEMSLQAALQAQLGTRQQQVPAYSAVKVNGQKLYNLARSGQTVDRPHRTITINTIHLDELLLKQHPTATITVQCSKGTYIRALAEEIADSLDTVAHLTALRRLASGQFTIDQAITLEQLTNSPKPEEYLRTLP